LILKYNGNNGKFYKLGTNECLNGGQYFMAEEAQEAIEAIQSILSIEAIEAKKAIEAIQKIQAKKAQNNDVETTKKDDEASCEQVKIGNHQFPKIPVVGKVGANIIISALFVLFAVWVLYSGVPSFRQSGLLTINKTIANMTSVVYPFNTQIRPSLIKPVEGIGLFAVIYLFAQLIERVVELFSEWSWVFLSSQAIEQKKMEIDLRETKIKKILEVRNNQYKDVKVQKNALDNVSKSKACMETIRKARLWAFSSLLGAILCYVFIGLFELAGIPIAHIWDALFSGILIGGGTKSLHDLITYVEKNG
jgi:hypothetical protein